MGGRSRKRRPSSAARAGRSPSGPPRGSRSSASTSNGPRRGDAARQKPENAEQRSWGPALRFANAEGRLPTANQSLNPDQTMGKPYARLTVQQLDAKIVPAVLAEPD